ncbi:MAG: hypothetical protein R6V33_01135 [Pelovirga sp.]
MRHNEDLLWQGRPAPRCYLMRHWRSQIICIVALVISIYLFVAAFQRDFSVTTLTLLLLPVLFFLALGPVHLIVRRRRWESVFYAVTSQRLLIQRGANQQISCYPLTKLQAVAIHSYTEHLADVELIFADSRPILFECLEEPENCLRVLPPQVKVTSYR